MELNSKNKLTQIIVGGVTILGAVQAWALSCKCHFMDAGGLITTAITIGCPSGIAAASLVCVGRAQTYSPDTTDVFGGCINASGTGQSYTSSSRRMVGTWDTDPYVAGTDFTTSNCDRIP